MPRVARWWAALGVLSLLCGCSGGSHPASPTGAAPSTASSPSSASVRAAPSATSSAVLPTGRPTPAVGRSARTFVNPVFGTDFPDPGIIRVGRLYYAYSTNSAAANVPVMTSPDLVSWTPRGDAMPRLDPRWTTKNDTWAPEVIRVGSRFVLFYTAPDTGTGTQCIGRAVSTSPLGPFVDRHDSAIVCQNEKGGSIDPSPYRAPDGQLYLLWKNDGNCCGYDVDLWSQRLSADGLDVVGAPTVLLEKTKPWQGKLIEGPELVFHGGSYWLFYAANDYASANYAEGVARCRGPVGPCVDSSGPILTSTVAARGPGHAFIVRTPSGQTWMAFHAWAAGHVGQDPPGRQLWLTRLTWTAHGPVPARPTTARQTTPS
jgi:beta-xylosidase